MTILIVGAWKWHQFEPAFAKGLEANGIKVLKFSTDNFFTGLIGHFQMTLPIRGPAMLKLNRQLLLYVNQNKPDWILFWRPTHIYPQTLHKIKQKGIKTASYNNDDPFGPNKNVKVPWHHHFLWFWYLRCLSNFDRNYFFRKSNCKEAEYYSAQNPKVLMPYFIPDIHRPISIRCDERHIYDTDVVFAGHFEPDGRDKYINALLEEGIKVKVWGGKYWENGITKELYDRLKPINEAPGDTYINALCGAKICLAFLSKINRDNYTIRCFEIPACGKVMLAERTDELLTLFKEDQEACFFSDEKELIEKVHFLLQNEVEREKIAKAGFQRVWDDAHDVNSRAKEFIDSLT